MGSTFPNPADNVNIFILNGGIVGGIIAMTEAGKPLQIYQDGSGYYASGEYSMSSGGTGNTVKTSIKFTISGELLFNDARNSIDNAIMMYNKARPHQGIGMKTLANE